MNRVVLCGRLAGRPKLAYTPCGIAVAEFRLLVPREPRHASVEPLPEQIDCVVFRKDAEELVNWGDVDYRVNLEGRLRCERYWNLDGRHVEGLRVHADAAYFVDPVGVGLGPAPQRGPNVPLPVAIGNRKA